ncbi:acyl transferase domain-containing protein/NAD(P)H-dependent flavin oxidoreductase YrpB (nitropropane dioxygenase family)/acyl carrier protein [Catenulispora sp. GP43]|uniref:SDR family NAD(P)-dependent oxidoreductase n=1 Tax=Catenulispora sp. GP43 TaxID=3156263 RepID=UPI0035184628
MPVARDRRELVVGIGPAGVPNARLAAAVGRGGGVGVVDLGSGGRAAREALASAAEWCPEGFGVRCAPGCGLASAELAEFGRGRIALVVLAAGAPWDAGELAAAGYRVLVEVTSVAEARAAAAAGAHGLVARGAESGGRVGELSTFVLVQALLTQPGMDLPVWAAGGIGEHTAAAAVIGGAAGVVLDVQLALMPEAELPERVCAVLRVMDGSETVLVDGHRVLRGFGEPGGEPVGIGQDGFLAARFLKRHHDTAGAVRAVAAAMIEAVLDGHGADPLLPDAPLAAALGLRVPVVQGPMTRVSDQAAFAAAVAEDGALPFLALALADGDTTRAMLEQTSAALGSRPWGVGILGFAPEQVRAAQLEVVRQVAPACAIVAGGRPSQARVLEDAGIATFLHVPSPGLLRQFLAAGVRRFVFEGSECGGHTGPRGGFPLWEAQLGVIEDWMAEQNSGSGSSTSSGKAKEPAPAKTGAGSRSGSSSGSSSSSGSGSGADTGRPAGAVQVLFAGGIHDARSAAMVAAMARPVVAAGVQVGVLMGTAYLFTEQAVRCGAIQPLFQAQALAAQATALLETAPGHTTRGLVSPFTAEFGRLREQLHADGVPQRQAWERLEQLNVGRLRIASKGLLRRGAELIGVGEDRQLDEGLFMAGQVAVLRDAVTTIADLHADVTEQAGAFYTAHAQAAAEALAARADAASAEPEPPAPLDIAIVGMACVFPGSPDLAAFWATVLDGADRIGEVPASRWDPEVFFDPGAVGSRAGGGGTPSKWGGFAPSIPFDPLRYGIPPKALGSIDPAQLLALEVARRALADAGLDRPGVDHERTSVVFGAEAGSDLSNAGVLRTTLPAYLGVLPPELDEQLPILSEDSFTGVLANVIAGRIANRLDLGGANYTVDAACASSLAAVDIACKELTLGTSDVVLCGGVDLHNGINDFLMFASVHALSPTGRSRAFDADADGIALGEGAACVVLKRLADAERDGDRVYAVVKGVGSASDGRALGLTAPRPEGQRRALQRSYRSAGVSAARIGLVEAHGTGTVVGDRTELGTLTALFSEAGAVPGGCALGSVKSQIGHTKCAAGLAGLVKTALAVHTGVRPPTVNITAPNPAWSAADSPFGFRAAAAPWAVPAGERLAGVSAFGFGGTNFHVVLAGHDRAVDVRHGRDEWPAELFVFRGADRAAAHRAVNGLLARMAPSAAQMPWRLRDLALAAARAADTAADTGAGAGAGRAWVALVASDLEHLRVLAQRALAGEHDPAAGLYQPDDDGYFGPGAVHGGGTALLFPGQGSQRPGMLAEMFVAFPELQRYVRSAQQWDQVLNPPKAFDAGSAAEQDLRIRDTRVAQPLLGVAGLAMDHLLRKLAVVPDAVGGHSYGELVALASAGVFDAEALLAASSARAAAILDAAGEDPGAMAAVAAGADEIAAVLEAHGLAGAVVAANQNSPKQVVISGATEAVRQAVVRLREAGYGAKPIPVACAFHSPLVAAAGEAFGRVLARMPVRAPEVPVWANRTAAPYGPGADDVRAELAAQIGAPVRFADQIEAMYAAGIRVFVEAGPGKVLTRLVGAILKDRPHQTVACEPGSGAGLGGFLAAVAQLATSGVALRTGWLVEGRDAVDAATATPQPRPGWLLDGHLVRTADGQCLPGGLAPARRIQLKGTTVTSDPVTDPVTGAAADALLTEFLKTNRDMIAAQRDVMLAYLGTAPAGPLVWQDSPGAAAPLTLPALAAAPEPAPVVVVAPDTPASPAPGDAADVLGTILATISARTGYPPDMIEPDLDLEADLSIDSIKRTEIAGELAERLGLSTTGLAEEKLEDLAKARTARAIADWLEEHLDTGAGTGTETEPQPGSLADPEPPEPASPPESSTGSPAESPGLLSAPKRFLMQEQDHAFPQSPDVSILSGTRLVILGTDGAEDLAQALVAELGGLGAAVQIRQDCDSGDDSSGSGIDGIVYLGALGAGEDDKPRLLPAGFATIKQALSTAPRWFIAATAGQDRVGAAGLAGLWRSIGREYPAISARLVGIAPDAAAEDAATQLVEEIVAVDPEPVVVRRAGRRSRIAAVEAPLGALAAAGAGPAGDGAAEAEALGLDRQSVVVLVGGARGITAHIAEALAAACRCRIELLGRTPLPEGPEPAAIAAAGDAAAIRAALIDTGVSAPAQIEKQTAAILAGREVAATLARVRALGAAARYHSVDVRGGEALPQLLKAIHSEHGRLDAVVYAAGVIEDKLIADKDPESFARVFATKTDGARALLAGLDDLPERPRYTVLFGSIAAAFGNRGQADYAAANDALQTLGAAWSQHTGAHCLTVHWGPWAPSAEHGGMVTPHLAQAYRRRGIELIDPEEGALALLRELAWGPGAGSVLYTASRW